MKDIRINAFFWNEGPEGPGWYLMATRSSMVVRRNGEGPTIQNVEEIIPRVRLSATEMEKFGQVCDNFAQNKPLNPTTPLASSTANWIETDTTLRVAIREGNEEAKAEIEEQIARVQREIGNLDILRQRAAEFDPEPEV